MNRAIALMYHDVLGVAPTESTSGFETPGADSYKVSSRTFDAHLDAIEMTVAGASAPSVLLETPCIRLTFDDGGVSAHSIVADRLEARGWRGIFFVTGSKIGAPGFLNEEQLVDLDKRDHLIGSHSHSHPLQMAKLSRAELATEWQTSCDTLAAILGHSITVASIPGGMYSHAVAEAAAGVGITDLFTSEPRRGVWHHRGTRLHGRYTVKQSSSSEWIASVVDGQRWPRARQRLSWESRKLAKKILGPAYLRIRDRLSR